jgi:Protein of unknown function (DUF1573)
MPHISLAAIVVLIGCSETHQLAANAEATSRREQNKSALECSVNEIDLGVVKAGEVTAGEFSVTSTGPVPLIVSGVYTGCGCVTATLEKQELLPGEEVQCSYSATPSTRIGTFAVTISIVAEDPNRMAHILQIPIRGQVSASLEFTPSSEVFALGPVDSAQWTPFEVGWTIKEIGRADSAPEAITHPRLISVSGGYEITDENWTLEADRLQLAGMIRNIGPQGRELPGMLRVRINYTTGVFEASAQIIGTPRLPFVLDTPLIRAGTVRVAEAVKNTQPIHPLHRPFVLDPTWSVGTNVHWATAHVRRSAGEMWNIVVTYRVPSEGKFKIEVHLEGPDKEGRIIGTLTGYAEP